MQLDGNDSLGSLNNISMESENVTVNTNSEDLPILLNIPVHISARANGHMEKDSLRLPSTLKSIRRDNRSIQALSLPIIAIYNARSLWPKIESFATEHHERDIGVSLISEVWEKIDNKKHLNKIAHLMEMEGITYISTPRSMQ